MVIEGVDQHMAGDLGTELTALGLRVQPIPTAGASTAEALREAIASHVGPVLLRGLADGWPARHAWSPRRLACDHGEAQVTALMGLPSSGVLYAEDQRNYERILPLADFITSMLSATADAPCYLAYQRVAEIFPPGDYDFASLLGPFDVESDTRVWMGSRGTRSMLHSDLKDNLFCQVWGQKHVVLLPWANSRSAYPFPDNVVNSQLDLASLDLRRHPKLLDTVLYSDVVRPGDVLYIPRGWWHDIRSTTPSVSLNHWFGPPLEFRDYAGLLLQLGPRCWWATARDFVWNGFLQRPQERRFFFSPPSTGKRVFDAIRWGNFSRDNDPAT